MEADVDVTADWQVQIEVSLPRSASVVEKALNVSQRNSVSFTVSYVR